MSVTGEYIFTLAMALINEMKKDGTLDAAKTAEYRGLAPSLLSIGQSELLEIGQVQKSYEFSNYPVVNKLGDKFDVVQYDGNDKTYTADSAKAYCFEVDGEATITIEDSTGTILSTINVPDTVTSFTRYKGLINSTYTITIRFSGSYAYNFRNFALIDIPYKTANDIPDYAAWIKKDVPSDFQGIDKIIEEESESYIVSGNYKFENNKELYVSHDFQGNVRINYYALPTAITSLSQTLQIDDAAAITALSYYLASHLMITDNPDLAGFCNDKYMENSSKLSKKAPLGEHQIRDVYGGFSS